MPVIRKHQPLPTDIYHAEVWRDIPEYDGLYQASDYGRIRTISGKASECRGGNFVMKPFVDDCGYLRIALYKEGKYRKFKVHRLVAFAFVPNPDNLPEVNHINGLKTDNRPCNLEWMTRRDNSLHAIKYGLQGIGEKSPRAKMTEKQVLDIRADYMSGISFTEILSKYNTPYHATYKVITNKNWKHLLTH